MKNKYIFSEKISTIYALFLTKLFFSGARLIRRPVYMRGKKSMKYGKGFTTGYACRFDLPGDKETLFIGEDCRIGDNVHIVAYNNVKIGKNVLMASKIFISDTNHGCYKGGNQSNPLLPPNDRELFLDSVLIGDNVWIGENVVILPGVKIGNGCVIGANAVVSKDIPANSIAVGCPAQVIKKWDESIKGWKSINEG